MSAKAFFDKLASRTAARFDTRKNKNKKESLQRCPLTSGDILIVVYELDTFTPISGMSVNIPALGAATTDASGVAEWLEKDPAGYTYAVTSAGTDYADGLWRDEAGAFALGANSVQLITTGVMPTGKLHVQVKLRATGALLPAADVLSIEGMAAGSVSESDRVFDAVEVGDYVLTAKLAEGLYMSVKLSSEKANVKKNETTDVELLVDEMTWVELKLMDVTRKKIPVSAWMATLALSSAPATIVRSGRDGIGRREEPKVDDQCNLSELATDDANILYQLDEIV
jgi:hypothetical protein